MTFRPRKITRKRTSLGEILVEEFLSPLDLSLTSLSKETDIPLQELISLVEGERISQDLAEVLGTYFDTSFEFWLNFN